MERVSRSSKRTGTIVVKLGGSLITDKSIAYSYRKEVVRRIGRALASSRLPIVLVHGGGSFGHTLAKKHGLSSRRSSPSPEGVSETRDAMFQLNAKVCASLSLAGMHPYSFSPFTLLDLDGASSFIDRLTRAGMTPVTFGDVVHDGKGFKILSGDTICVEMAEMLGAPRCIMATDVEGILDDRGKVISIIDDEAHKENDVTSLDRSADSTGGIAFKVHEAMRMALSGTEVRIVSGLRPAEFSKALKGVPFHGTTVRVAHGVARG